MDKKWVLKWEEAWYEEKNKRKQSFTLNFSSEESLRNFWEEWKELSEKDKHYLLWFVAYKPDGNWLFKNP